jgi:hypothetical protein
LNVLTALWLQVKAGEAAPSELQREQEKLGQMDSQLQGLQSNYSKMTDQAAALLQRMGSSSADAAADGSAKAASGITGAVYAGLKFGGLAMRIAGDVVSSVTDDAGKMLRVSDVLHWGTADIHSFPSALGRTLLSRWPSVPASAVCHILVRTLIWC